MKNDRRKQMTESYAQLRRLLLHGQLPGGTRITETQWAQKLGVHRGSLREAMGILAHEGLLTRGEGGGFFVPELGVDEIREIVETRLAIETGAIRLAGLNGQVDVSKLREACAAAETIISQGFDLGFAEADRKFHEHIVELSGNTRLARVYMHAPLPIYASSRSQPQRGEAYRKTLNEHLELCDLIENGKTDQACEKLQEHLLASIAGLAE